MGNYSIRFTGKVQGVGFRPHVSRTAQGLDLKGAVRNEPEGVCVVLEVDKVGAERFCLSVLESLPMQAVVESTAIERFEGEAAFEGFEIQHSSDAGCDLCESPRVTPDLSICEACREEILSEGARRSAYPFTNCTQCGPRFSIIESVPYDRENTVMREFEMCDACRSEYSDPIDRRFHAQPIACPECGPRVQVVRANGESVVEDWLSATVRAIRAGEIVALKGLGGFQLIADASNAEAVSLLRKRKHRPRKPFAVMCSDLAEARKICDVSNTAGNLMRASSAPIVVMPKGNEAEQYVCDEVAPGHPFLGLFLPTSPLHVLLLDALEGVSIVATSGNLSEEPIAIANDEAMRRLGRVADLFVLHDRGIVRPVDDSVWFDSERIGPVPIRRSRGHAPESIELPIAVPSLVAVGGGMKVRIALANERRATLSQHIGDPVDALTYDLMGRTIEDLSKLFHVTAERVICDAHPDYMSTQYAEASGLHVSRIQHHKAHFWAGVAEHDLIEADVAGLVWDGTGYGEDGTIWGSECFLKSGVEAAGRVAGMRPFPLIGGDAASRDPKRIAFALLRDVEGASGRALAVDHAAAWEQMLVGDLDIPFCGSMGRLFDGVAALLGLMDTVSFEGEAAMQLQFAAMRATEACSLPTMDLVNADGGMTIMDWRGLIEAILQMQRAGRNADSIALGFHYALAETAAQLCRQLGLERAVCSGGCFQNLLLVDLLKTSLGRVGVETHFHKFHPTNDAGISFGQIVAYSLNDVYKGAGP